ncbi:hypothetical protein BJ322DRAFT_534163 [Thelephora terrestris]|uniref:Uncharacterized protein n=1 Tax=Thelephora terrestris TaxID=56493 RepID=A0A9P6LA30_9AGAM|nr:hypothetical protein BJ322DRAFT_534163 [Thelephora terrestris]
MSSQAQVPQHLYTLEKSSPDFSRSLYGAFIRLGEKGEHSHSLQRSDSARLVDFLDRVCITASVSNLQNASIYKTHSSGWVLSPCFNKGTTFRGGNGTLVQCAFDLGLHARFCGSPHLLLTLAKPEPALFLTGGTLMLPMRFDIFDRIVIKITSENQVQSLPKFVNLGGAIFSYDE